MGGRPFPSTHDTHELVNERQLAPRANSLSLGRERARVRVVHHAKQPPHPYPLPRKGARDIPGI